MIYCYPSIDGQSKRHTFYEYWNEVPVTAFVAWSKLAKKIRPIEDKLDPILDKLVQLSDKRAIASYQGDKQLFAKLENKIKQLNQQSLPLQSKYETLLVEMIACFTSVPKGILAAMPLDSEKVDDSFVTYRNRLRLLTQQPLPDDFISEFKFQTKTDEEIQGLMRQYKNLSWLGKRTKAGRNLWAKIKAAKNSTYKIKDIWLQTTVANKYFQEQANDIADQMQQGNYENLPKLVALLVTEASQEAQTLKAIREGQQGKAYLETYRAKYLELVKYRIKIFTQQAKQFDVATLKRIANFFLCNYKT